MATTELQHRYGPWALIAGASEGIGEAFSRRLAAAGIHVILLARRADKLETLAEELRAAHGVEVRTLSQDLGAADLEEKMTAVLEQHDVGLLVYNACYSFIGRFEEASLAQQTLHLDVNCRGPLIFAHLLAPKMIAKGRGGLLFMSSMSGFQGSALVSTYAATKAFDTVFAEGLWSELGPKGVDVLGFVAGATSTPNFKASTPDEKQSMAFPMTPDAVAEQALSDLLARRGPTRIAGRLNGLVHFAVRHLLGRRGATRFMSSSTRRIYG